MKIKAGIVGATGYAGAELVRLLSNHPEAEVAAISSVSFEGQKLSDIYPSYTFLNDMICENSDAVRVVRRHLPRQGAPRSERLRIARVLQR